MKIWLDINAWPNSKSSDQKCNIQGVAGYKYHSLRLHAMPNNTLIVIPDNEVENILSKFMNDHMTGSTVIIEGSHSEGSQEARERGLKEISQNSVKKTAKFHSCVRITPWICMEYLQ